MRPQTTEGNGNFKNSLIDSDYLARNYKDMPVGEVFLESRQTTIYAGNANGKWMYDARIQAQWHLLRAPYPQPHEPGVFDFPKGLKFDSQESEFESDGPHDEACRTVCPQTWDENRWTWRVTRKSRPAALPVAASVEEFGRMLRHSGK